MRHTMVRSFTTFANGALPALIIAAVLALAPAPAAAQEAVNVDAGSQTPGAIQSRFDWRAVYDDNVFRSATQPVSDVVSTLSANITVQKHFKRVGLTASGSADWEHFQSLVNERGANGGGAVKFELPFNHVTPYVSVSYLNSRHRQNLEVDTRPRIEQASVSIGGLVRIGGKTTLDVATRRARETYDRRATSDGVNLGNALNRAADSVNLSLRQEITPLTRLTVTAEAFKDEFSVSSIRSADNYRMTAGFESLGRLTGRASAGFRMLKPHDPSVADSRGLYLAIGTTATLLDRLQIRTDVERDVAPSYRTEVSYYAYYSYTASVTCALGPALRLSAMAGRRRADYRSRTDEALLAVDFAGLDTELTYGSGIGYRLGQSMSIDFRGQYVQRKSTDGVRRFDGMSLTAGVSHVF